MAFTAPLVARRPPPHKPPMLFDPNARRLARQRARRIGGERFLLDRAFAECRERLLELQRPLGRLLLIGALDSSWSTELRGDGVDIVQVEFDGDEAVLEPGSFDAALAVGALDTLGDLPLALATIRFALRPGTPFIGAVIGGESLPALRAALLDADRAAGQVAPRAHPRIAPSALAGLLQDSGFVRPVVDVDRFAVRYRSLAALVRDLRAMAATNILSERRRASPGKAWRARLDAAFLPASSVEEKFELLHFLAWAPPH